MIGGRSKIQSHPILLRGNFESRHLFLTLGKMDPWILKGHLRRLKDMEKLANHATLKGYVNEVEGEGEAGGKGEGEGW